MKNIEAEEKELRLIIARTAKDTPYLDHHPFCIERSNVPTLGEIVRVNSNISNIALYISLLENYYFLKKR